MEVQYFFFKMNFSSKISIFTKMLFFLLFLGVPPINSLVRSNNNGIGLTSVRLSLRPHSDNLSINTKGSVILNNLILRNNKIVKSVALNIFSFNGNWKLLNTSGLTQFQQKLKNKTENVIVESLVTNLIINVITSTIINNQYTVNENKTTFNCQSFTTYLKNGNNWGSISSPTSFKGPGGVVNGAYAKYYNGYLYTCFGSPTPGQKRTVSIKFLEYQQVRGKTSLILHESFSQYTIANNGSLIPASPVVYSAQYYRQC